MYPNPHNLLALSASTGAFYGRSLNERGIRSRYGGCSAVCSGKIRRPGKRDSIRPQRWYRFDCIERAVETAHAIHRCCPKAQFREITGLLATRGLGGLEAMAKTPEIDRQIKSLITTFPNRMPPEPTKEQLRLGIPRRETTNHFASRVFGWMAPALQKYLVP